MRYVFLVYRDGAVADPLASCQRGAMADEAARYREQVREDGRLVAAAELEAAALLVRAPNGALEIGDGPPAVADERLCAVWLTEARDLNEAIRLAARMPEARFGSIEIRPVQEEAS
jgi:hypothetical protein